MDRKTLTIILAAASAVFLAVSLVGIFVVLPVMARVPGNNLGFSQKIFYWHMPAAIISFIAFLVTLWYSIRFLATKDLRYDIIAYISAELGLIFGVVLMVFGVIWNYLAWGAWWTWDPRLTTYLILLLLFGAYFFLRSMVEDRMRRATYAAVFGIIAALDVPVSFFSTRLIQNKLHPVVIGQGGSLAPEMYLWLAISMVGMILLYLALLLTKLDMERMEEKLADIKDEIENGGI